jgi:hypothetical protein
MVLTLVAALTLAQEAPAREDEALAFARTLLAEQDVYRAIGELKRFSFQRGGLQALSAQLLIGHLYAKGRMVDASRFHLERVLLVQEPRSSLAARLLSLENVCVTRVLTGNCAEEIDALPDDTPLGLKRHLRRYFGVLMDSEVTSPGPALEFDPTFDHLKLERASLDLRRPWLAGVLSAVLPGAGQLYDGRPLDAVLAFVLTGACVAGTVALLARPKPEWGFGIPLGLLGLVFYTGNIVNAVGDAHRINERAYADFAKKLEAEAWPKMAIALGPNGATFTLTMSLGGKQSVVMPAQEPQP